MKDFVSFIKNISTEEFIRFWAEVSILIYKKQLQDNNENEIGGTINFPLKILQAGFIKKIVPVMISAWDISDMAYTSICVSNDYRREHMTNDMAGTVTNLYRGYENAKSGSEYIREAALADVYKYLMGMTFEQFRFQNLSWTHQNFNRNYHMMVTSDKINRSEVINIKEIIQEKFEMGIDELLATEFIILWLCSQYPDPLSAPEELYTEKNLKIVSKQKIEQIIKYYTIDYQQVRDSKIKKQIFYSKPFVKTQKSKAILMVSLHLLQMSFADCLYWLERDYYLDNDLGQAFINNFGKMFEDYFEELAELYLSCGMWSKIPENKEKSADYYIEFDNVMFLFELKSGIMGIGAKQQTPDVKQIDKFYSRNIREAYEQLIVSEQVYQYKNKPIVKVFLLYEFANNTQLMMASIPDIFEEDPNSYILSIADLEMFLVTYKQDKEKFQEVINELLKEKVKGHNDCFLEILNRYGAIGNMHFIGERDYFGQILKKLSTDSEEDIN